ncbi:MAG TPA: 3' terminal RNA ribose 2'-O-methyltransferase Hen1 [Actinomycetota bacterium]|nr:3' terminal RNA ribose 2'-O-methyltransferase Hen1 [Actinomycetota bacterium]
MLLTITSSTPPADDLGYLLHKNPANLRTVDLAFGRAHVFWPGSSPERASVSLLVEVDPVGLVRRGRGTAGFALAEHVNDRPYVASSLMSVAIARLFGTAMSGRSDDRPDRVDAVLNLTAALPVVACRDGEPLLRRLFEPLGYRVEASPIPLDPSVPSWGDSRYLAVSLAAEVRVRDLLSHLYVLLPVLDDDKHYWVASDEIEKLLARGGEWLAVHPDKELITRRYLRYRDRLTREALSRLLEEDQADPDADEAAHDAEEEAVEERVSLRDQRLGSVLSVLRAADAHRVLDLGCGPGTLLKALMKEPGVTEVVGVDVSSRALDVAARRLHLDTMAPNQRDRLRLLQGSLTYRDRRLSGFDAAVLMEVVEHLEPERLEALERSVFAEAAPTTVIVTTPNIEYNVRFESLPSDRLRHRDHRFEWTRVEFRSWADGVAERNRYRVRYLPVGEDDPEVGPPTQLAVFVR